MMKSKIWIALIALYIVWGSTYLGIKVAIETIPPFFHAAVRFFISGLILIIWQRAVGADLPTRRQWMHAAIVGNLLLLGGNGLLAWAEQTIPSGTAAIMIGSIPIFLVIAEAIRPGGAKPTLLVIIGLLIGFAGIFVLVGPAKLSGASASLNVVGVVALLAACILWAIGSSFSRGADLPKSSLMTTGAEMLTGSAGLLLVTLLTGELHGWSPAAISSRSLIGLTYLITVGSLIGFVSYIWLLQNAPISLVATYAYVNPIVAVFLGAWIGQEKVEPRMWLAMLIIIGSVIFINSTRPKMAEATAELET